MENRRALQKGQLWKSKDIVICKRHLVEDKGRRVVVEKGEIVEFRFHHPANFRTTDGIYLALPLEEFYSSFEYYGQVWAQAVFANRNSLEEILNANMYDKTEESENDILENKDLSKDGK